jgi:hypothetical protein
MSLFIRIRKLKYTGAKELPNKHLAMAFRD